MSKIIGPGSTVDNQSDISKDQSFRTASGEIATRLIAKNKEYGSAYEKVDKIINVLYPEGVKSGQINDFLIMIRILDKICRISNPELSDESHKDAFFDIAGYGILGYIE